MDAQPMELDPRFNVFSLGPCRVPNPLRVGPFVQDDERMLIDVHTRGLSERLAREPLASFERAGPRREIFFFPDKVKVAIVTCGGLSPGINDVLRSLVHQLWFIYGVRNIRGVRFGYAGLNPATGLAMRTLDPDAVRDIHEQGGTLLGSSRGPQPTDVMVDCLVQNQIDILFTVGGDGTLHGAQALVEEIRRRKLPIAVVGIPKTIDNDIYWVTRTFGFETAVAESVESIRCAHTEAASVQNGVGLVKLMGRESGFVAAHATLAQKDVNFVLIPEIPFVLDGPNGLLAALEGRLQERSHAVVVVAEGSGQDLFPDTVGRDASGNKKLGDIGVFLRDRMQTHFASRGIPVSVKYIDPSYIIRSVPANPTDRIFCGFLGQFAVHAALAGKSGLMVGSLHDRFVHIPLPLAIGRRKKIDPCGPLWRSVLESTGQPTSLQGP